MSAPTNEKLALDQHSIYATYHHKNDHPTYDPPPTPTSRLRRALVFILTVVLPFYLLVTIFGLSTSETGPAAVVEKSGGADSIVSVRRQHPHFPNSQVAIVPDSSDRSSLIPLEVHIMSKCPDARDCLRDLVVPAMEKISDLVDFRVSFIGSIDRENTVHCKHGPTECLGNMISLCADSLFPNDAVVSLGFTNCMISSYTRIPSRDLVESCALEHGIEFSTLNTCISDEGTGMDLLSASIERSRDAGVATSCTVRVQEKSWCVRDDGEWKGCDHGHEVANLVAAVVNGTK